MVGKGAEATRDVDRVSLRASLSIRHRLDTHRINRSKKSVELSSPVKPGGRTSSVAIPLTTQSSSSGHVYPASELQGLGIPAVVLSQSVSPSSSMLSKHS